MEGAATSPEAAEAVARVLRAGDHYEALGAPRDAELGELRRCYLAASVKVHPDKNHHPDATSAFQRLAAAWAVLSDEAARRRYDAELRTGRPTSSGNPNESSSQAAAGLDEAFAVFAFAAAACAGAGGGGVGDFAEVLLCAQALASMRESGQAPDARALAGGGIALSAGLRIIGAAAHGAGFKDAGAAAERAAGAMRVAGELAAVGAAVAQLPAVQEALESGRSAAKDAIESSRAAAAERAQQLGTAVDGARSAVRERAQQLGAGPAAAQLGAALGGAASWAQRARQRLAESLAGEPGAEAAPAGLANCDDERPGGAGGGEPPTASLGPEEFQVGARVRLRNLRAAAQLNGRLAEVVGFDAETERYRVQLLEASADEASSGEGSVKRVKPENMVLESLE